jgi:hypothetical protein
MNAQSQFYGDRFIENKNGLELDFSNNKLKLVKKDS